MPILPIIDLCILLGWTSLLSAFVLKAIYITTHYRPTPIGMGPADLVMSAGIFLIFAIALAARVWVKQQETSAMHARARAMAKYGGFSAVNDLDDEPHYDAAEDSGPAYMADEAVDRARSA